ncbi:MAG: hypothetical protein M3R55_06215 [Acidobacteriota bacterium]|nr:hypothetical protein [Acidobacteriota bacterium]
MKVYLLCAALFFLAAPFAGFTLRELLEEDTGGVLGPIIEPVRVRTGLDASAFAERFDVRFQPVYTASLTISMLGAAAALALLYRRQRRPFGAHVIFAVHYVSFLYLAAAALGVVATRTGAGPGVMLAVSYALLGPYLIAAMRYVFGEGWGWTAAKAVGLLAFAFVLDSLVNFVALVLTLALM